MGFAEFLLLLLVCWTVIGVFGVSASVIGQNPAKALRNFGWIIAIWAIYLTILVTTSLIQKQSIITAGQAQCFDKLCFTVVGSETLPGYLAKQSHLVRVKIQIQNRSKDPMSEPRLHTYLVDQQGRRWDEVPGLSGVRLGARVPAGITLLSEPVFKLPDDAIPVGIVLTRGHLQPRRLVIGDRDSLLHRPTVALLGR